MSVEVYGDRVATMGSEELDREIVSPSVLRILTAKSGRKQIEGAWAPFDHINHDARIMIVGITPGREQMRSALHRYRLERQAGADHATAGEIAKKTASFSGPMRATLVRCLDEIGLQTYLGISTSADLWTGAASLAHFSSALRWPIFVDGKNYTGTSPAATNCPELMALIDRVLVTEIMALRPDCLIAPLGNAALEMVQAALRQIEGFDWQRLLAGLPHPSGGNRDVSSQFLGDPPSPTRSKPLNPHYRQQAKALRTQLMIKASSNGEGEPA